MNRAFDSMRLDPAPGLAPPEALERHTGFRSHGLQDPKPPVPWAEQAVAWLEELGLPKASRRDAAGHERKLAMAADFRTWIEQTLWS